MERNFNYLKVINFGKAKHSHQLPPLSYRIRKFETRMTSKSLLLNTFEAIEKKEKKIKNVKKEERKMNFIKLKAKLNNN